MAYDEDLAGRIRAALGSEPAVTEKKMFGGLAFLIGGHMAVSASGSGGLLLRVDPQRTAELINEPAARPFEMRGREMDGWLRIDPSGLDSDRELQRWVTIGAEYARSLPPK